MDASSGASTSLCPITLEGQHGRWLAVTFNRREAPSSCSHLGKSPWPFIHIRPYMVPEAALSVSERRKGQRCSEPNHGKRRHESCMKAVDEPVRGSWVSPVWPALLQTVVSPSRWQLCSCFVLFWHEGYHREHYSKEMHPFYFFPFWSIKLQFDFRVKIWINSHFLQNDSLLYTKEQNWKCNLSCWEVESGSWKLTPKCHLVCLFTCHRIAGNFFGFLNSNLEEKIQSVFTRCLKGSCHQVTFSPLCKITEHNHFISFHFIY